MKVAKITLTIQMDEDPDWLEDLVEEWLGEEGNPKDNDHIQSAITEALSDDIAGFFAQIDSVEPFTIIVKDKE